MLECAPIATVRTISVNAKQNALNVVIRDSSAFLHRCPGMNRIYANLGYCDVTTLTLGKL
jgi:hypothetical protein